jgi:carbon-monoxide dehydrogenase large subunit
VSFLASRTRSAPEGVGKPVRRREDPRLVTGAGCYALPRADALPSFVTELSEVPSTSNPLGLRGGGEGGTTPALGAVVNAVVDALAEFGVEHLDMPVTPERVWRAIHDP